MNATVYNTESTNRVNNTLTADERRAMVGTADTMAAPTPDDWKLITLDANDPAAVMRLVCTTPDGLPAFTAGWTDRAAALRWMEREQAAHAAAPGNVIKEKTPTRLVFTAKGQPGEYVHELRPVVPADIISEAKAAQKWNVTHEWNYGPIDYLKEYAYKVTDAPEEWANLIDDNAHKVTDPATYCVHLLSGFDVFVDEDAIICAMRRAFPRVGFREVCKMINDHMGENQQGDGISLALVPDIVLIESKDDDTREKFRKRHEVFNELSRRWDGDNLNTHRAADLRKRYDLDSLAAHLLLSSELFYIWESDRAARCLEDLQEIYPDATANDLHRVFMAAADGITAIYG